MSYLVAGGGHKHVSHMAYYTSLYSSTCLTTKHISLLGAFYYIIIYYNLVKIKELKSHFHLLWHLRLPPKETGLILHYCPHVFVNKMNC